MHMHEKKSIAYIIIASKNSWEHRACKKWAIAILNFYTGRKLHDLIMDDSHAA